MTAVDPAPALEIRDLRFARRDGFTLRIPHFRLERGEQCLLAGPSGCGKSTLLLLAAGLLDCEAGSITVGGHEIAAARGAARDAIRASRIGMVFQTHHLLSGFTARENVAAALLFAGVPPREHHDRADQLLTALDIARPDARVDRLSVGQQQRVAIARALAGDPELVLADEPTASLDPDNAAIAIELLQNACGRRGAALLVTSHDPSLFERFQRIERFDELTASSEAMA
jgi:putative ABC transport system ATP-binding protein